MPLFDSVFSTSSLRFRRFLRDGVAVACGVAVLTSSVAASASEVRSANTAEAVMEASRLRIDARLAAEQGDFLKAAESLEAAALRVGDRDTAGRAAESRRTLEAGGGAQTDFQSLITLILEQTSPPALWILNGEEIGSMTPFMQGVFVGVPALAGAVALTADTSGLKTAAELARTANRNQDVQESSQLRLISLPRLEHYVKSLVEQGHSIPDDVACLAGMTEVHYLFVFPETSDIVIGGPAGAWSEDDAGRTVGADSGRPTLRFDDLVTLSRTFSPSGPGFFMCSIDPKAEQVKAVRDMVARTRLSTGNVRKVTKSLEDTLGLQSVIVQGIPHDSRVASVIVEADYQMKLIGIGRREGAKGMKSYFDLAGREERRGSAMDALRWWMVAAQDAILVSPDQTAFEFSGREVACQSENQLVAADGSRQSTGKADSANARFAELFTTHLPELAQEDAVFADLQNVFDLGLATAIVHTLGLNRQVGWRPEILSNAGVYAPASVEVPEELMTAAASRTYSTGEIVIQVAGGIRGDLRSVVRSPRAFQVSPEVAAKTTAASPVGQSGRWWWDAAQR